MPITPQEALQRTIEHREIFHDEMLHLMRLIMNGELSPVMTGESSPFMMSRIRCSISSWKISRCSIVRCSASWGVMGMECLLVFMQRAGP